MRPIVITGAPGAGKTTLLAELAARGFRTVSESAREVIAERLARGEPPRPEPAEFAREILRRDAAKFALEVPGVAPTFFDRSAIEALGMVDEATPLGEEELHRLLAAFKFHKTVFVLPPWEAIYQTDAERDHTFEHAQRVHTSIVRWYGRCAYSIEEVPHGFSRRI